MQSNSINQATQQGEVKFMVGDKVKYKEGVQVIYDHNHNTVYTVEDIQSEKRIALVESAYVAHPDSLELVSRSTKHKHYDLIVEWAKDPANVVIEYKSPYGWLNIVNNSPSWRTDTEYRIRPKTKQVTRWKWAFLSCDHHVCESYDYFTEEEALMEFPNATPYKLEHTAITTFEEV